MQNLIVTSNLSQCERKISRCSYQGSKIFACPKSVPMCPSIFPILWSYIELKFHYFNSLCCREFISLQETLLFIFLERHSEDKTSKYCLWLSKIMSWFHFLMIISQWIVHFRSKSISYSESAWKTEPENKSNEIFFFWIMIWLERVHGKSFYRK
jgi:hypothetical protein